MLVAAVAVPAEALEMELLQVVDARATLVVADVEPFSPELFIMAQAAVAVQVAQVSLVASRLYQVAQQLRLGLNAKVTAGLL